MFEKIINWIYNKLVRRLEYKELAYNPTPKVVEFLEALGVKDLDDCTSANISIGVNDFIEMQTTHIIYDDSIGKATEVIKKYKVVFEEQ